ncbi:MAG: bifunctional 3-deoxy-7-phosphoheptulonate synthase/chorismate mutase type II [Muribaculaceae bacterium]|nr:bifunctional 3-deoxy-7-phosphoheptulonate synthase/chorismate mutase type II [Muribaculaceae bacterium]
MQNQFDDINSPLPSSGANPAILAGPCSAESRRQMLDTARALADGGISIFRAGIWKPRTRPGGFEGVGLPGLDWLAEVKAATGMAIATEAATPAHVKAAAAAGVDILWIGARTSANPFAVQEIADALAGIHMPPSVIVKNPVSPDINLWIGALQRIREAGITALGAAHRGFTTYGESLYRNTPHWAIPFELRRRLPGLTLLCDPSHIAGRRGLVEQVARKAIAMHFDGLIIECHCSPDEALSDAAQQLTPAQLFELIKSLPASSTAQPDTELESLREQIDRIDESLIEILAGRMELTDTIGRYKQRHSISAVQPVRYRSMIESRTQFGQQLGLSPDFLRVILSAIHEESVRRQVEICCKND